MPTTTVDKITALLEQENPDAPFFVYHEAIKQIRDEVANMSPNGGSQPEGVIQSVDFVFTEEATAGVYTVPPLTLPENGFVLDVQWWPVSDFDWAADTAVLDVVDSALGTQISAQDVKNVPAFTPVSAADVVGLAKPYVFPFNGELEPSEATITITITTTIAVPPVVPAAVMIVRVFYLVPPTPVAAVFA